MRQQLSRSMFLSCFSSPLPDSSSSGRCFCQVQSFATQTNQTSDEESMSTASRFLANSKDYQEKLTVPPDHLKDIRSEADDQMSHAVMRSFRELIRHKSESHGPRNFDTSTCKKTGRGLDKTKDLDSSGPCLRLGDVIWKTENRQIKFSLDV